MDKLPLWPHQARGIGEIAQLIASGCKRIAFTAPTGLGKSRCANEILSWGLPALMLCNRTMLFEQLGRGLAKSGIYFDTLASGYAQSYMENVTLGMMQTISKRWTSGRIELPPADLVILDEAHNETGRRSCKILKHYQERGATTICLTATPIGIGHMADHLVVAGNNTEGRACGALVPASTYAPDEPDPKSFKASTKGIIQFKDEVKEVMLKVVTGRVLEHYFRHNPDQRPAVLFAPGVAESAWICDQFREAGVPWSHIDSKRIVLNGEVMPASRENRDRLLEAIRTGETKGVSNRFVLREGIDLPQLYHCIFACTFGSLTSYLQAGGRILRSHPSLDHVLVTDHGGNYWRYGSLNEDREWSLDDTEKSLREKREAKPPGEPQEEAIVCPQCSHVRSAGAVCPQCGFAYKGMRRIIVQTDGTLRAVDGPAVRRSKSDLPDAIKRWISVYYMCKNSGKTFSQAWEIYKRKYGVAPRVDFPMMPKDVYDWKKKVSELSARKLTGRKGDLRKELSKYA